MLCVWCHQGGTLMIQQGLCGTRDSQQRYLSSTLMVQPLQFAAHMVKPWPKAM
jgi:hypothetical protein